MCVLHFNKLPATFSLFSFTNRAQPASFPCCDLAIPRYSIISARLRWAFDPRKPETREGFRILFFLPPTLPGRRPHFLFFATCRDERQHPSAHDFECRECYPLDFPPPRGTREHPGAARDRVG